jgi:hypothetical protein
VVLRVSYKILIWLILVFPVCGNTGEFCLLLAENYYEQLYCEVTAQGQGKRLPSFYDFQKNNEMTQALLLKRPAARLGVQLVQPAKNIQQKGGAQSVGKLGIHSSSHSGLSHDALNPWGLSQCSLEARKIICSGDHYQLVGNQANKKLTQGVLGKANRMEIPVYRGVLDDTETLDRYLTKAYQQYIQKMLEIGLGGSTFSYAKFVFLFHDVTAKGIDFSQRFETMFGYLKQDKQNLAVNERLERNVQLVEKQCDWLAKNIVVCDVGRKNYLYLRQY